jgi:hypothetical protein
MDEKAGPGRFTGGPWNEEEEEDDDDEEDDDGMSCRDEAGFIATQERSRSSGERDLSLRLCRGDKQRERSSGIGA